MKASERKTFAVIGAGPKGLAVAVKAKVLEEFGLPVDRVVLIERHAVAAHWSGEHGYTDGEMKLGTSPEKDVVYPLVTKTGLPSLDQKIRRRLMDFSWTAFLIEEGQYADWVDRGRPAPCHQLWAQYLRWVAGSLAPQVRIEVAHVQAIDVDGHDRWKLELQRADGSLDALFADRLMLTGPGRTRRDFLCLNTSASEELPPDTFDLESFWSELKAKRFPLKGRIAIVGAGENAASVLLSIAKAAPDLVVDVISPKGFVSTRSENFYENRFYSQPNETSWKSLSPEDRADFIGRTDLGVFSVHAMEILNGERRHRIVPGRLVSLSHDGNVVLRLCYNGRDSHLRYDRVVLATGFDQTATIRRLFTIEALARVEGALSGPLTSDALSSAIESDLSVRGLTPALHLPMLAGLAQGPGFANLSCLGLLSDRAVLEPTLRSQRTFRLTQEAVL